MLSILDDWKDDGDNDGRMLSLFVDASSLYLRYSESTSPSVSSSSKVSDRCGGGDASVKLSSIVTDSDIDVS